jgi:hypothetical protein
MTDIDLYVDTMYLVFWLRRSRRGERLAATLCGYGGFHTVVEIRRIYGECWLQGFVVVVIVGLLNTGFDLCALQCGDNL